MIRAILLLSLALAGPAQALSCVTPDAQATFDRAAAAEETYYIAHGSFGFDELDLPGMNGSPTSIRARFLGKGLTQEGFTAPFDVGVTLDIGCAGAWCGGIFPGRDMLVFLEQQEDGLHLALPACADTAFDNPAPALLDRIAACFKQGFCGT